jgi:DNA-binding NtrC family response regulator
MTLGEATRRFQVEVVRGALETNRRGGRRNIAATAKTLGVARSFLYRLIEEMEKSEPGSRGKTR